MKNILCYGDSNTFGYNPFDCSRYGEGVRWTSVLQNNLKNEFIILEEGVCDRTGFVDNDKGFDFSAQKHFPKLLSKTDNIDILILAIGTNDLQFKYNIDFDQIENGLKKLILIAEDKAKKIILIPPVILNENVLKGYFNFQFDDTSILKSKNAGKIYKQLSEFFNLIFIDFNDFVKPSSVDGLHYDEKGHGIIAEKLTELILS